MKSILRRSFPTLHHRHRPAKNDNNRKTDLNKKDRKVLKKNMKDIDIKADKSKNEQNNQQQGKSQKKQEKSTGDSAREKKKERKQENNQKDKNS